MPAHVMSRGNDRQCIFTDDRDREKYVELMGDTLDRFAVTCHAFCQMTTHAHLLLSPTAFPLSRMMQHLNSHYCQWFNARHARVGHVLQGRYKCRLVEGPVYFLDALRYLALNPVVAGYVAQPVDWPWSSYRATMGLAPVPSFLHLGEVCAAFDAPSLAVARPRLSTFVMSGEPLRDLWARLFEGSSTLAKTLDPLLEPHRANCEFNYVERFATRPPLARLLEGVDGDLAREDAVYEAFCRHAYTLKEIGDLLRCHPSTIWRWVRRAETRRGLK
jgi:REP element-mobilizing transposase RayT